MGFVIEVGALRLAAPPEPSEKTAGGTALVKSQVKCLVTTPGEEIHWTPLLGRVYFSVTW